MRPRERYPGFPCLFFWVSDPQTTCNGQQNTAAPLFGLARRIPSLAAPLFGLAQLNLHPPRKKAATVRMF